MCEQATVLEWQEIALPQPPEWSYTFGYEKDITSEITTENETWSI